MRSGRPTCTRFLGSVAATMLIAAASGDAHARTEVQGIVSASTGWTNNAGASTEQTDAATTSSVFTSVTPGLEVFWEGTKTVYRLTYNLGLNFFYAGEGSSSLSNNLSLSAAHSFSPRVDGLVDLSAAHTQNNTNVLGASASGEINALPAGTSQFLTFATGMGLTEEISPMWRSVQGVSGSYTTPIDGDGLVAGASFNGQASLGFDRALELGGIGIALNGGYTWIEAIADPMEPPTELGAEQENVQVTALARWSRQLSPFWTTDISAGYGGAALLDELGEIEYFPSGSATLNYTVERGSAGIGYSHGVSFNPFIRSTIVADDVVIRGGLPIGRSRWLSSGALGYQHARTILGGGVMETTVDLFSVDLAVTYQITPSVEFGARYQFAHQNGDSELVPDQIRNSVSAVLTARYPDRTRTTVPFRQPLRMLRDPTLGNESARPRPTGI